MMNFLKNKPETTGQETTQHLTRKKRQGKQNRLFRKKSESGRYIALSQTQLMILRFKKNKAAGISLVILIAIYAISTFAEFFAPYGLLDKNNDLIYMPPMKVHIFDEQGKLSTPYVYKHEFVLNTDTFRREYVEDRESGEKYFIRLFVKGTEYNFFGIFRSDLHLFGVDQGYLHLAGTTKFGYDLFSLILFGTRVSIYAGLFGVVLSLILGTIIGTASGYLGGMYDMVIQRVIEFIRSFPRLPLWMTLSVALPPTWSSVKVYMGIVTILALIGWTGLARQVRGKVLSMSGLDYVMASKAANGGHFYIITNHLIPNVMSHVVVSATLAFPAMILGEAGLSFLGLGIQAPMTSLGVLLQEAQNIRSLIHHPWLFTPAYIIIFFILSFNFLGDGVRDAVDPYST